MAIITTIQSDPETGVDQIVHIRSEDIRGIASARQFAARGWYGDLGLEPEVDYAVGRRKRYRGEAQTLGDVLVQCSKGYTRP